MSDLGGDPACWAHLQDELDLREPPGPTGTPPSSPIAIDISAADPAVRGAAWSLPHGGDLDANLVRLPPGELIERHTNDEVDVFVITVDGTGVVAIDQHDVPVVAGSACLLPRGAERSIRAGDEGLTYFTVHRRREGLTIGPR